MTNHFTREVSSSAFMQSLCEAAVDAKLAKAQGEDWSMEQRHALNEGACAIRQLIREGYWAERSEAIAATLDSIRTTHPQASEPALSTAGEQSELAEVAIRLHDAWLYFTGAEPSLSRLGQAIDEAAAALLEVQPKREQLTDAEMLRGARELCKIHSEQCGVDEIDCWTHYSDDFKNEFRRAIESAHKIGAGGDLHHLHHSK